MLKNLTRVLLLIFKWNTNLKTLHLTKLEKNTAKRTSDLSGIRVIGDQFENISDTLIRASKHKIPSSTEDNLSMIKSLVKLQPFPCVPGCQMTLYNKPIQSPWKNLSKHTYFDGMDWGKAVPSTAWPWSVSKFWFMKRYRLIFFVNAPVSYFEKYRREPPH